MTTAAAADLDDLLGSPSPLDRPLNVSIFTDRFGKRLSRRTASLREVATMIEREVAPSKAALPLLKLGTFGTRATGDGSLRSDANLATIAGVEADYDGEAVTVADARARLADHDIAALVYSTPSHRPDAPRWRVLAPCSGNLDPSARDALTARLNGALGGILAPESFTRSQAYYFGRAGNSSPLEIATSEGRFIDQAADVPAIGKRGQDRPADDDDDFDLARLRGTDLTAEQFAAAVRAIQNDDRFDDRDSWLGVGAAIHHETDGSADGLALFLEWSATWTGGDADERAARAAWKSFGKRRTGPAKTGAHVLALAQADGWENPARAPRTASRLTFLTPAECETAAPRGYVVKGLLAPGDIGCIFGAPGAGKSLIAPFIGYQVALGRAAFGMRTRRGGVFYVAAEDPSGMQGRITALKMEHGEAPGFVLVRGVSDLLAKDSPDLAALIAAAKDRGPALIFVDTLAMAFPGLEENSADGMGRVVAVARSLAKRGAAVILIHHDTKAEGSTPRGHSLLNGALDVALHLQARDDQGVVRGRLTKSRNGPCDRDLAFTIAAPELGTDEDGDAITAAMVNELAQGAAPRRPKLRSAELAAFEVLKRELTSAAGSPVAVETWRAACLDSVSVSAADKVESRQRATRRAMEALARVKMVDVSDGFARIITEQLPDTLENAFDEEPSEAK